VRIVCLDHDSIESPTAVEEKDQVSAQTKLVVHGRVVFEDETRIAIAMSDCLDRDGSKPQALFRVLRSCILSIEELRPYKKVAL
jgi:hypothetical protein